MNASITLFDIKTHNGLITVYRPSTQGHRTFKIKTVKKGPLAGKRVAMVLSGKDLDDPRSWKWFAFVDAIHGATVWKRYALGEEGIFAKILNNPLAYQVNGGLEFQFAGTCRCCNKTLTNPESILSGIGPVCEGKAHHSAKLDAKPLASLKK